MGRYIQLPPPPPEVQAFQYIAGQPVPHDDIKIDEHSGNAHYRTTHGTVILNSTEWIVFHADGRKLRMTDAEFKAMYYEAPPVAEAAPEPEETKKRGK